MTANLYNYIKPDSFDWLPLIRNNVLFCITIRLHIVRGIGHIALVIDDVFASNFMFLSAKRKKRKKEKKKLWFMR